MAQSLLAKWELWYLLPTAEHVFGQWKFSLAQSYEGLMAKQPET